MGLPLPLATCLSWVGPPTNLGGWGVRALCEPWAVASMALCEAWAVASMRAV